MPREDEAFLRSLLATFRQEADEHLGVLSAGLLELENAVDGERRQALVEGLFREAHSLKGAARAVELGRVETVCQTVENVFASWKRDEIGFDQALIDALDDCVDCLRTAVAQAGEADDPIEAERTGAALGRLTACAEAARAFTGSSLGSGGVEQSVAGGPGETGAELVADLSTAATDERRRGSASPGDGHAGRVRPANGNGHGGVAHPRDATPVGGALPAEAAAPGPRVERTQGRHERSARPAAAAFEAGFQTDTVRVATSKLEELMLQAEEFVSVKLTSRDRSVALREMAGRLEHWKREWYRSRISGDPERLQEFLEWNSAFIEELTGRVKDLTRSSDIEYRSIGPMVDELVDGMKKVLMLPFSFLLSGFPKMVRDLGRDEGKQVDLRVSGAEVEVDKRIIENLKDPLTHLLRNCVDHGIEPPEERRRAGKPERGTLRVDISQLETNKVAISVSDDGGGIDVDKLRAAAIKAGVRNEGQIEEMGESEILQLVFCSGLSTNPIVTDVSGRGLGLAIVQEKVERLGGTVTVDSLRGVGSAFRIVVPSTLATTRGIVVTVSDWSFVLPVVGVDRVARVRKSEISTVENRETVLIEGRTLPMVHLNEVLRLPRKTQRETSDYLQTVVLGSGDERVAFVVDQVKDEQEVLVKTLGPQLVRVRHIAGATILGSSKVVPILNVTDLLWAASHDGVREISATKAATGAEERKSILIAEDSITSRMLLKSILESAGYCVTAAVDGLDAYSTLQNEDFDLVISDVEMPRMDGFELTTKIRSDQRLCGTPVMLVTGLESREHKERGIDVGANAYITKSSFTQGTLLETARSLL